SLASSYQHLSAPATSLVLHMRNKMAARHLQAAPAVSAGLQVVIPHRKPELTRADLKYAATFADGLDVRLRLIDVHVVPYGVPLDEPTVNPKHITRRLRHLTQEIAIDVSGDVVYARDWAQG